MTKLALAASLAAAAAALLLLKKRRKNSHDDEALEELVREARAATRADPRLRAQLRHCLDAASFEEAVGATVAARVADGDVPFRTLRRAFVDALKDERALEGGCAIGENVRVAPTPAGDLCVV